AGPPSRCGQRSASHRSSPLGPRRSPGGAAGGSGAPHGVAAGSRRAGPEPRAALLSTSFPSIRPPLAGHASPPSPFDGHSFVEGLDVHLSRLRLPGPVQVIPLALPHLVPVPRPPAMELAPVDGEAAQLLRLHPLGIDRSRDFKTR